MEEEKSNNTNAKMMLLEIFKGTKEDNTKRGAVYIEEEWNDLDEESVEYFEPPVVPRSCDGQNITTIRQAFRDDIDHSLSSQLKDTQSFGSTVSFHTFNLEPPMEYEEIIQKLEGDIRKHIRIQNQLKLHIESLQGKFDEKDKIYAEKDKKLEELNEKWNKFKQSLIDLDRK